MTTTVDPFLLAADQLDPPFDADEYAASRLPNWRSIRRPNQVPPTDPRDWYLWLIMAGRGWGKTRTGAEWLLDEMTAFPDFWYAIVGPTIDEGRDIMIEGESGLLACADARRIKYHWNKHLGQFTILGGARADLFTAEKPDGVRGPNLRAMWGDEPASWRYGQEVWDTIQFAMRKGDVRACMTGTPKTTDFMKYLISQADVITRGHTDENKANLSEKYYSRVILPSVGTRLGRRELAGEMLEDVEGALWNLDLIDANRVVQLPMTTVWENGEAVEVADLQEVVVAIDPAVTAKSTSDETGIVAGALGGDGHVYILSDRSGRMAAAKWATTALGVYDLYEADRIIGEVNNGGDLVLVNIKAMCQGAGRQLPKFKAITASRGKAVRAEPVVGLDEQGLVHHVGVFPKMEDEMTSWVPSARNAKSPNRIDARVYAVSDLLLAKQGRTLGYRAA